jgi:cyclic pyranopterin monophosphate synthase
MRELHVSDANPLSHLNERGEARMVDVSDKTVTAREAIAAGFVAMLPATLALVIDGDAKKGDVLATARIAGIMAAKKTHELIPLCHPLPITKATVDFDMSHGPVGIHVQALVKVTGQTGVEMEALTAVSVACLTIYDMLKAVDKGMILSDIRLIEKTGGRSGTYRAPPAVKKA